MHQTRKFKRGAASFYIVAISTLILVIIAASFATVIISEVTRTSNDDLSQSAYDSALAGVEDAKLVLHNYQQCKSAESNQTVTYNPDTQYGANSPLKCTELVDWIEKGNIPASLGAEECDVLPYALSRSIERNSNDEKLGVLVQEGNDGENDMQQYYPCVKIATRTDDVIGKLNSQNPEESFHIRFVDPEAIKKVKYVRLNWHVLGENADSDRVGTDYMEFDSYSDGVFRSEKPTPAVVSLAMVQTDGEFNFEELAASQGATTDRGTLYFVPTYREDVASDKSNKSYTGIYGGSDNSGTPINLIDAQNGFVKSNDKGLNQGSGSQNNRNLPFAVFCGTGNASYICSANAEIPDPIGGSSNRNPETFVFSVALPYGEPETQFSLEFYDDDWKRLQLDGVQISVDSTGRANDLFRRIDTRLKPADAAYPYPIYGIQALNNGSEPGIWKDFYSTCEYNFDDKTCP